jgi:uncharacterized membrane protein
MINALLGCTWLALIARALHAAPWSWLRAPGNANRWLAMSVVQFLLWQIRADVLGVPVHLLGTTVMTLMFGWRLAVLGGTLAVSLQLATPALSLGTTPLAAWLLVGIPVGVSYGLARAIEARLPRNFFVYVYLSAFAGGALSMLAVGLVRALIIPDNPVTAGTGAFMVYILLTFPEAFLSGASLTLMVAYKPHWVVSFADALYLRER